MSTGARITMDTGQTGDAMSLLSAAGATLTDGWSTAAATIGAAIGQLGGGPLGQAFLQDYQQHADEVAAAAAACAAAPGQLAGTGQECITRYETADVASQAALLSVSGPTNPRSSPA